MEPFRSSIRILVVNVLNLKLMINRLFRKTILSGNRCIIILQSTIICFTQNKANIFKIPTKINLLLQIAYLPKKNKTH